VPLRTMSSGVLNSGLGWYKYFINRHVDVKYNVRDYKQDMRAYLQKYNMQESETVAMMTAVNLKNVGIVEIKEKDYSLMIVTTAEAKRVALREVNVLDQQTNTLATGTSTDSILVAATQTGHNLEFAGPITPLGSKIGTSVHQAITRALKNAE